MKIIIFALASLVIAVEGSHVECLDGWTVFDGACYKLNILPSPNDFGAAKESCERENSRLASIRNKDEMDFVLGLCSDLKEKDISYNPWIGLVRKERESDQWKWLDGTTVEDIPWGKDEPNNHYNAENCVELIVSPHNGRLSTGTFNDKSCCTTSYSYICKQASSPVTTTMKPTSASPDVPTAMTSTELEKTIINNTSSSSSHFFTFTISNVTVTSKTTTTVQTISTRSRTTTITSVVITTAEHDNGNGETKAEERK